MMSWRNPKKESLQHRLLIFCRVLILIQLPMLVLPLRVAPKAEVESSTIVGAMMFQVVHTLMASTIPCSSAACWRLLGGRSIILLGRGIERTCHAPATWKTRPTKVGPASTKTLGDVGTLTAKKPVFFQGVHACHHTPDRDVLKCASGLMYLLKLTKALKWARYE